MHAIRHRLAVEGRTRDLAMFQLAIDCKLRSSDLIRLKLQDISDTTPAGAFQIKDRAVVRQKKTNIPVHFEITDETKVDLLAWINKAAKQPWDFLFTALTGNTSKPISTRQYSRLVKEWIALVGLTPSIYGTHSIRRTKVALLYAKTGNLKAAQTLLGHASIENTAKYLGVSTNDALSLSEAIKI